MTDHEQWDELAAGYALHALAPDEESLFVAHLDSCDRCTASVDEHALVAAQLGSLSHPGEALDAPSWSTIRAAVVAAGDAPESGDVPESVDVPESDNVPEPGDTPELRPVDELAARRARYALSRRVLATAAAVAVLAGGGVLAWRLTGGGTSAETALEARCTAASGCHLVHLVDPAKESDKGTMLVRGDTVTILPTSLKAEAANRTYVLWQVPRDGRPAAIGRFRTTGQDASGHATIKAPYSDTLEFAVSSELVDQPPSKPSNVLAVGTPT